MDIAAEADANTDAEAETETAAEAETETAAEATGYPGQQLASTGLCIMAVPKIPASVSSARHS